MCLARNSRNSDRRIPIDAGRAAIRKPAAGFTLLELLFATSILTICVVALGMMARAVEISSEYNQGYGTAALHAQVTFDQDFPRRLGSREQRHICRHVGDSRYGRQLDLSRDPCRLASDGRHAGQSAGSAVGK